MSAIIDKAKDALTQHNGKTYTLAGSPVGSTGFGLMGLTWRPNPVSQEQAFAAMKAALDNGANFFNGAGALAYAGRYNDMETGYAYGGGIEWAIPTDSFLNRFNFIGSFIGASAITLKAEYLHYDLGSRNVVVNNTGLGAPSTGSYTSRFSTEGNLIKAGFNYKFGGL